MKIAVLTSGGDAPGMNAFLARLAKNNKNVFAVVEGFKGLIEDNFLPLESFMPQKYVNKAGTIIKSARCSGFNTESGMAAAVKNLQKREFDFLVICGGNGSLRGAKELAEKGIVTLFVPGTIDNDVSYFDLSLGFDSAVFQACYCVVNVMPSMESFSRTCIFEVMGRDNANIAKETAKRVNADYIIATEKDIDIKKISTIIKEKLKNGESTKIILRENITDVSMLQEDLNKQLKNDLVRYNIVGYTQRGGFPTRAEIKYAYKLADMCTYCIKKNIKNQAVGLVKNKVVSVPLSDC